MKEIAFGLVFAALVALGAAALAVQPRPDLPVAVFMAPGRPTEDALQAVVAADGVLLSQFPVVVTLGRGTQFIDRLYQAGALFVGDATALGLCITHSQEGASYAWN
ncbi:hypothetical protein H2509_08450 [Stappia sp. F7233]|uniref:Uncharacterized protein n=1 Tax=Stappia albiluteola TaxID=2758565 RepID=A0A839ADW7_9HYPH|nr:hypothetical protein [Stappia albiluteola]MBA5777154.1 hypothetical protein [Stappia albiluteola]